MTRIYIPRELRDRVAKRARFRCGYCLTLAALVGSPLEIEHIIPASLGGLSNEGNLWLACSLCNEHKGTRIAARDPLSEEIVPLFNPRHQVWAEHFAWTDKGTHIVGLSKTGRATVLALSLNRPSLVFTRTVWVAAGLHPPRE
ncbi:MAG TPA: HNH endonuclease [Thermoanaerobaculia bacterium]|nr:HNH endonuclease [Thermoanaerobaculia bacterium]